MSEFVSHTPEDLSKKPNLQDRVDKVADLVGNLMGTSNADEEAWIKRAGIFQQIQTEVGYGFRNAGDLLLVQDDDRKTEKQKELAKEAEELLVLGTAKALIGGSNEDKEAIGVGSIMKIKERLPEELNGLEKKVRDSIIDEPEIQKILDPLDIVRKRVAKAGETGQKVLEDQINKAQEKLILLEVDSTKEDQLGMVVEWLGREGGNGGAEGSSNGQNEIVENSEGMEEFREAQRRYFEIAERDGRLKELVENISLEEILDAYMLIKAPRERSPQLWEYSVPGFMNGMSLEKWRKLLSFEDAWLGAIYNKRASSEYNNSLEKMKDGILNMKSLAESDIKMWYEDNTLNLRGVMHQISRDLLTEKTIKQDGQTCRIYAFDTKKNPRTGKEEYIPGSRVEEFVNNEDIYKQGLAKRLVEMNVIDNEKVAKLSVALAMDIMEMGGVFSVADSLRGLSWESDAVRLAQRPERKYSLKVGGGELFAGPWTELANTLSQGDLRVALELVKSWGVVPELLSGSFLDQRILLTGGKKSEKTMMEMIYRDERIPFRELENDLFFSWRKDHVMPAARMWMYITNKTPLEFSRNREGDTVISQWRADLYNDINQLRKNSDSVLTTPIIAGAVGGSIGLYPFEGPYLRIGTQGVHGSGVINYSESVIEIITGLGMNKDESNQLLRFFGVDRRNYKDLSDKFVAYTAIRNLTLPEFYRRKSQRVLSRKRPFN